MRSEQGEFSPDEADRGDNLISTFAELCETERDRYLLQASRLIENGSLEIFRNNCKFRYHISENDLTFHVNRMANNTSFSGRMPMSYAKEELIEKLVTVFAQSEASSGV